MAIFRKVHTSFWGDSFSQSLTPEQRYFFLYLITNERTKQCGIYDIGKRQMCFDTGYNIDTVSKLLEYFINTDKVRYNSDTNEIAIKNWNKYNGSSSPKVQECINQELILVKDRVLIDYVYSIDRVGILHRNKNKNKNKNKSVYTPPIFDEVKQYFLEAGFTEDLAKRAYDFYAENNWYDSKGNQVKNWRQKMKGSWMKKEKEVKSDKPLYGSDEWKKNPNNWI